MPPRAASWLPSADRSRESALRSSWVRDGRPTHDLRRVRLLAGQEPRSQNRSRREIRARGKSGRSYARVTMFPWRSPAFPENGRGKGVHAPSPRLPDRNGRMAIVKTCRNIVYRPLPRTEANRHWLGTTLESQRQPFDAALEERIDCCRKTGRTITPISTRRSPWRNAARTFRRCGTSRQGSGAGRSSGWTRRSRDSSAA